MRERRWFKAASSNPVLVSAASALGGSTMSAARQLDPFTTRTGGQNKLESAVDWYERAIVLRLDEAQS
jgi:hypothetical protein